MKLVELKREPSQAIVARLEKLLEAAKAGDIVGLVVAWEYPEGGVGGWWELETGCRPTNILGQMTWLQTRLAMWLQPLGDEETPHVT